MADFGVDLKARIVADAGVIAADGTRVHWGQVPQGTELPYVRLQVISDPRDEHLKGRTAAYRTRVQVDAFATKWGEAREIARAVAAAVSDPATQGGTRFGHTSADDPRDLGEDVNGSFIHRASLDLLVRHLPAD